MFWTQKPGYSISNIEMFPNIGGLSPTIPQKNPHGEVFSPLPLVTDNSAHAAL